MTRIAGSADLYQAAGRSPTASINFVTAHDGFTVRDLVSYERKHNEANGEQDRDGTDDNRSWNCGAEGPVSDPGILALRARQARALLGTLLLSRGVPMLLAGDELGRTQGGNNNAYCQDNPTSWLDWDAADTGLIGYTRRLLAFRRAHPVLRKDRFLADPGYDVWFTPAGRPMTGPDWQAGRWSVAIYVDGSHAPELGPRGQPLLDGDLLILVNGSAEAVPFTIPETARPCSWRAEVDSFDPGPPAAKPARRGASRRPGGRPGRRRCARRCRRSARARWSRSGRARSSCWPASRPDGASAAAQAAHAAAQMCRMRRPVIRLGVMRMKWCRSPPAQGSTPAPATEASSASDSTWCAEPWMSTLQPSRTAWSTSSTSNATRYSAPAIPVRRSSSVGLCSAVRNTMLPSCTR